MLRVATGDVHARLDGRFAGMVEAETPCLYHRFVRMNHACHAVVEPLLAAADDGTMAAVLAGRPDLLRALETDMAAMALTPLDHKAAKFSVAGPAEAAGLLYVLEGSRLGARYLHHALTRGDAASRWPGITMFYLESAAKPGHFSQFLDELSSRLPTIGERQRSVEAALAAFSLFEKAADEAGNTGLRAVDHHPA
ncbi:biliverdin-producing heme oxygenase [Jiella sp. M17.18]|uniref:biliverdin-producing heme oxygenase n=1 Tax=Jiella sp. M17.18 TaxID=3234247 RepID=UPI0034DF2ABD